MKRVTPQFVKVLHVNEKLLIHQWCLNSWLCLENVMSCYIEHFILS